MKILQVFLLAILLGCAGSARAAVWNNDDLTTYAQGSWGGDPTVDAGAALLFSKFATVYGATFGVTVGLSSGFTMSFTDAPSVQAYIPSVGPFAPLDGNALDLVTTASGAFGGEVLALQFNVDFSDANLLPRTLGLHFGDLILANFTGNQSVLDGLTVRQFLADMNILLGGGTTIIAISDLDTLPGDVNGSFSNGTVSQFAQDHLVAPDVASATPLPAALPLFASGVGLLGYFGSRRKKKAVVRDVMKLPTLGSAAFAAALLCATAAQASPYIVTFEEVGSNVVATGSGEFDTMGLTKTTPQFAIAFVFSIGGSLALGSPGNIQEWAELNGPVLFGTGEQTNGSGTGDVVGLQNGFILFTPLNYVSGDPLNDTATFPNSTFASLGLTLGNFVWSWGTGADQTFTLQVGPTATTPLPAALPLFATGVGGIGLLRWRRKKKSAALAA